MKAGILTYYAVFNHGAVLQANALKKVIESLGHSCEIIQFNRNYDMIPQERVNKYNISIRSIGLYVKYLRQKGLKNTLYNFQKSSVLKQYRRINLPLGKRYTDFDGDIAIIGSDEVFSLEIGVNPWLYGHGIRAKRVISYGASFGPTTLEQIKELRLDKLVGSGIAVFDAVSVRDKNSAQIVKSLTGRDAEIVCDPVILYGYQKEMLEYTPTEKKYIIIYSYENNLNQTSEIKAIRTYAQKYGYKVYAVAYYHGWCDKNIQVTPNELLGWIKNAALVVTDTFHGAVLSLVCNTPMVVKLRGNQNKLGFLMNEYNLGSRIISDFSEFESIAKEPIDFDAVNTVIAEKRVASMQYLRKAFTK